MPTPTQTQAQPTRTVRFSETTAASMAEAQFEPGVVRNCKLLGLESLNRRRYLDEAVAAAAGLYEGRFSYIDHAIPEGGAATPPRKFLDKFGRFKAVRHCPRQGIYGDFHYNTEHPAARTFEGWLKTDPSAVGFSHVAVGKVREGADGIDEVYEITAVESVDLVADPATTGGIYEVIQPKPKVETHMDTPADVMPGQDGYESHVGKMVAAIMTDSSMDAATKKKKILAALKLVDDGTPAEEYDDNKEMDDEKAQEWLTRCKGKAAQHLRRKIDEQKVAARLADAKAKAQEACAKAQLPTALVTPVFLDDLAEALLAKGQIKVDAMIADRKLLVAGRTPVSYPAGGNPAEPTLDDFLKAVN